MTTKQPSPGAMRAAEEIADIFEDTIDKRTTNRSDVIETLAILIDRETAAPDLLAALELIVQLSNLAEALKDVTTRDHNLQTIWATANTAIAKAEGTSFDPKGSSFDAESQDEAQTLNGKSKAKGEPTSTVRPSDKHITNRSDAIEDRETGASDLSETVNRELLAALKRLAVTAAVINNREPIGAEPDSRTSEHWSDFREAINRAYVAIAKGESQ